MMEDSQFLSLYEGEEGDEGMRVAYGYVSIEEKLRTFTAKGGAGAHDSREGMFVAEGHDKEDDIDVERRRPFLGHGTRYGCPIPADMCYVCGLTRCRYAATKVSRNIGGERSEGAHSFSTGTRESDMSNGQSAAGQLSWCYEELINMWGAAESGCGGHLGY